MSSPATPNSSSPLSYVGLNPYVNPPYFESSVVPTSQTTQFPLGTRINVSGIIYEYVSAGVWQEGGEPPATTTTSGSVQLSTYAQLASGTPTGLVPTSADVYTFVNSVAVAGAPDASTTQKGIVEEATSAEVVAGTAAGSQARLFVNPGTLSDLFASPPALGGTAAAAGTFTTLDATGAIDFDVGGTWDSAGTAIDIGTAADTDAINVGTGAAARTITIGNVSGATAVAVNTGTGSFTVTTTGTGDIVLNSDDTMLLDADGVLELNSSGGAISIGNDADAQAINIGTGGAARTITLGNSTGATSLVLDAGTGALNIGTNAIAHTITIGNVTGATALNLSVGTGNFTLDGVGGSTYTIGASTTTGTITIGGTAQTGTFGVGVSSGAMTMNLLTGNGAKTLNIATGVTGNTVNLGTGINTSAQVINVATGASGANSTVNILSGNGTAGTQTLNALTGTRAGALNLATGAAAHVIAIGSASAGAVTVDTAAGISLDGATASNFTVTGAADLTVSTTLGSLNLLAGEADAAAVRINASDAAGGIDVDAGTAGIAIDTTGALSIDSAGTTNLTATGAFDVTVETTAGSLNLLAGEAAVNAVRINASNAAGGIDVDAGTGGITIDTTGALSIDSAGTTNLTATGAFDLTVQTTGGSLILSASEDAADAVQLLSTAGGIDILATGAAAQDIDIVNTGGSVNITATESISSAIVINASGAAGGVTIDAGTSGFTLGTGIRYPVTAVATAGGTYTILNTDYFITTDSTGGAFQVDLPATPVTGMQFVVYDGAGQAAIGGNVTVSGNGNNIAAGGSSAASKVINTAYESYILTWNGTIWCGMNIV